MSLSKQLFLFMIFNINNATYLSSEIYTLPRISIPTSSQINIEKNNYSSRQNKKLAIKLGSCAMLLAVMYMTYNTNKYFKKNDQRMDKNDQRVVKVEKALESIIDISKSQQNIPPTEDKIQSSHTNISFDLNPIKLFSKAAMSTAIGTKNFITDIGKCIIETCPIYITGIFFTTSLQLISNSIIEASKQETLTWYIEQHTQIWSLFKDITHISITFDPHSDLISLPRVNEKSISQMNAYLQDISNFSQEKKDGLINNDYFDHACNELQKNRTTECGELEKLQNLAIENITKRKRAISFGLNNSELFQDEASLKHHVVDLCTMLTEQIQKVLSFTIMHINKNRLILPKTTIERGEKKISIIIIITNKYIDLMEKLLNMNSKELENMSIENRGMFTCTYEFEKSFKDHISILHRYCALIC